MGSSGTVQEKGLDTVDGQIECANGSLTVSKGNVATVNRSGVRCLKRLTRDVCGALSDSVVAGAELELNNVSNIGLDGVGHKGVLRTANNDRDQSTLPAMRGRISSDWPLFSSWFTLTSRVSTTLTYERSVRATCSMRLSRGDGEKNPEESCPHGWFSPKKKGTENIDDEYWQEDYTSSAGKGNEEKER